MRKHAPADGEDWPWETVSNLTLAVLYLCHLRCWSALHCLLPSYVLKYWVFYAFRSFFGAKLYYVFGLQFKIVLKLYFVTAANMIVHGQYINVMLFDISATQQTTKLCFVLMPCNNIPQKMYLPYACSSYYELQRRTANVQSTKKAQILREIPWCHRDPPSRLDLGWSFACRTNNYKLATSVFGSGASPKSCATAATVYMVIGEKIWCAGYDICRRLSLCPEHMLYW